MLTEFPQPIPLGMKKRALLAELAAHRVMMEALRLRLLIAKANFNPAQARVPAGDPDGGQWTDTGASGSSTGSHPSSNKKPPSWGTPAHIHPGADVNKNMKEAENHHLDYLWFRDQVHNKGPWDYKQQGSKYADFGNFNYGATGRAAGFSENTLLRMAGWAQVQAGTSKPEWGTSANFAEALLGIGAKHHMETIRKINSG